MKRVDEKEILDYIKKKSATKFSSDLVISIGDDAAVFNRSDDDSSFLISTDSMNEDIHFKTEWQPPKSIGIKLARMNISDIAAMGGVPKFVLLSINYRKGVTATWMKRFIDGFLEAIKEDEIDLIGGNISRIESKLSFSVTIIGESLKGRSFLRGKLKAGDSLYVTGNLGDSGLGRYFLSSEGNFSKLSAIKRRLVIRHFIPPSKVSIGRLLSRYSIATSMIDISDGVLLDLERLLGRNRDLGATINLRYFPLSDDAKRFTYSMADRFWEIVLTSGEDYELMFTVDKKKESLLISLIKEKRLDLYKIGDIVKRSPRGSKIKIYDFFNNRLTVSSRGWLHS